MATRRVVSTRRVRSVLRGLSFRPSGKGTGTGHELWVNPEGRRCRPLLRHKDISVPDLFCLARELEGQGVVGHNEFMRAILAN